MKFFRFGDFCASSLTRRATCAKVPRRAALAWFSNNAFDFDRSSDWLELSAYQNAFEILSLVASCFRGALPPDPFLAVCLGTVESGRCWVKAADVWSKVADVKAADVESKRPMLGPKWPMFGLKQPMFHRPLFWPKVADVV